MSENAWKEMDLQLLLVSSLKDGCFVLDAIGACMSHGKVWHTKHSLDSRGTQNRSASKLFASCRTSTWRPALAPRRTAILMFIVFRACRSSCSRFDVNWSSNLSKHFDFDPHISVFDSFCMHLAWLSWLHLGIWAVGVDQYSIFFIVGRPHPSAGLGTGRQGRSFCFLPTSKLSLKVYFGEPEMCPDFVFTQFALRGYTILVHIGMACLKGAR